MSSVFSVVQTTFSQEVIAGVPLHEYVKLAILRAKPSAEFSPDGQPVPGDAALLTSKVILDADFPSDLDPRTRVQTAWELARASRILARRSAKRWALAGVTIENPDSVLIGPYVTLEPGARIEGHARLLGRTHVAARAVVRWGTVIEDSQIGARATLGPYAHLRPGSVVGEDCKIGNFVELKNTSIGSHTSVAHLSYLGDATVGARVNIGCGFVTCNFDGRVRDGRRKHRTVIEDDVFMGSDCQTIAPLRVGQGAYVASGSTLTVDVPPQALAVARSRQVNKLHYAERLRQMTETLGGP